jgi:hypothetical protein
MKNNQHISFYGEKWKNVNFLFEHINDYRLEVSSFGRIRSFNKLSNGNILNGSITEGYKIIRLKFFKPPHPLALKKGELLLKKIASFSKKIKLLKENGEDAAAIKQAQLDLKKVKTIYSKHLAQTTKDKTIHYHSLTHRLVAEYFLTDRSLSKTIVAHADFDKLNNNVKNLKWMTPQENYAHQKNSPFVIEERERRIVYGPASSTSVKLTVTKVMLLKKMLNEGRKTVKQLAKQFKVSDMQIIRIRRGENWSAIPAAV